MIYGERTGRQAIFVDTNGSADKLKRIPFMSNSYNELWLQNLLEAYPSLIPSGEVGDDFSPLVCIGREVPVGSNEKKGYIDNLFLSPSGRLVVVETKLFRNHEARRTVVAQIIEYAKELQKWTAENLDEFVSDYYYKKEGQAYRCIDLMVRHGYLNLSDEGKLVDRINNNLSSASFLLMIIGDGIRSGVQQLADFLNDNASMGFNLSLVELEMYENSDGVVVVPNLLTKTTVIERTYINNLSSCAKISEAMNDDDENRKKYTVKPALSRREFLTEFSDNGGYDFDSLTEFICDLEAIDGISIGVTATELTVRFNIEESSYALITFSIASKHSDIWIVPGRIKTALIKHGCFPFEADSFLNFYKKFVDTKRCKAAPYENESCFYYGKPIEIFNFSEEIISAVEQFAHCITNK